jgi:hypothetical protein
LGLGRDPDGLSVAMATGDSSLVLTGTRGRSRAAGSDGSPGSDGPSPWVYDYTPVLHSHTRAVDLEPESGPVDGGT